jgi:FtsH-binding integral membrane protein
MVAFGGAAIINLMTLLFERESHKMQIALLALYTNMLAGVCHYLHLVRAAPITVDCWGGSTEVLRILMWLHTTPAMIYLLSTISDFSKHQVGVITKHSAVGTWLLLVKPTTL